MPEKRAMFKARMAEGGRKKCKGHRRVIAAMPFDMVSGRK
jgi:hypothetical protein